MAYGSSRQGLKDSTRLSEFFSGALQGPYTVSFLAGNEGMDIGDGYWGLCRGCY